MIRLVKPDIKKIILTIFLILFVTGFAFADIAPDVNSSTLDGTHEDDGFMSDIKSSLPPVPYKDEGLLVTFPTYVGMMTGGLAGLPIGMAVVLPAGIVGEGVFPIVLFEEGKDPKKDNPVPTGKDLAVMGAQPVIYIAYGLGYVVGFPFLAVKKIIWDLPKSLFYDPFHQEPATESEAVK